MTSAPANQPTPPPVAATVHIYRGLMDSASTWRTRIDNPTNWAIITSGTVASFALNDESHSHAVLLLAMLLTVMFMSIEARRTRYYHLWSSWLRLLETEYFAPILKDNCVTINDTWQALIVRDLGFPHFKTTYLRMLGRRLRDVYLAIYTFLIVSWFVKLLFHRAVTPQVCAANTSLRPALEDAVDRYVQYLPVCQADSFMRHAAVGPIPGWAVILTVVGCYVGLITLMLLTYGSGEPSIEVLSRERTLQKLVSPAQQPVSKRPWQASLMGGEYFDHPVGRTDLED
jgi:uncharacterized membrane protein